MCKKSQKICKSTPTFRKSTSEILKCFLGTLCVSIWSIEITKDKSYEFFVIFCTYKRHNVERLYLRKNLLLHRLLPGMQEKPVTRIAEIEEHWRWGIIWPRVPLYTDMIFWVPCTRLGSARTGRGTWNRGTWDDLPPRRFGRFVRRWSGVWFGPPLLSIRCSVFPPRSIRFPRDFWNIAKKIPSCIPCCSSAISKAIRACNTALERYFVVL